MPILKHAKKKLKQDKKRTAENRKVKEVFKKLVKTALADKKDKSVSEAFSALDKAVKKNILNKNKVARMKSSLAKHVSSDTVKQSSKNVTATPKKTVKRANTKSSKTKKTTKKK